MNNDEEEYREEGLAVGLEGWSPRCSRPSHTPRWLVLLRRRYPLADSPDQYLPVATTRPETLLGDTAVAVNPKDER